MSDDRNTLHRIAEHLAKSVEPLIDATRSVEAFVSLMHRLGWDVQSLPPSYANLGVAASDAIQAARALSSDPSLGEIRAVVDEAGAVYRALQSLGEAPAGVDAGLFLAEIAETLFEFLLVRYLVRHAPDVYSALEALGVIEHEHHPSAAGRPAYVRSRLNYREIVEVLTDPMGVPNRVYGWGSNDLDFPLLAVHLMQFSTAIGLLASHGRVEDELGEAYEASGSAPPDKTITIVRKRWRRRPTPPSRRWRVPSWARPRTWLPSRPGARLRRSVPDPTSTASVRCSITCSRAICPTATQ